MNLSNPCVSVVIPTYNRADLVVQAIDSVVAQTYENWELIVVDDGSTDDTRLKLEKYETIIRYIYQENGGASAAQNKGIEIAKGEWIAILASDDIWLPQKLAFQMEAISKFGRECSACITNCTPVGNPKFSETIFEKAGFAPDSVFGVFDDPISLILGKHPTFLVQSLLVKKCLVEGKDSFDLRLKVGEDTDFLFRLCFKTNFCFVNKPLVNVDATPNPSRLTSLFSSNRDLVFDAMELKFKKWISFLEARQEQQLMDRIESELKVLYGDYLNESLKSLKYHKFVETLKKLNRLGEGKFKVLGKIIKRFVRKLNPLKKSTSSQ